MTMYLVIPYQALSPPAIIFFFLFFCVTLENYFTGLMYTSACWLALTSFEFMYEAKLLGLTTLVCLGVGLCWLWGLT